MGKLKKNKLYELIHEYFTFYLPAMRKISPNTIRSYQKGIELLLDFVAKEKDIKLSEITFDHINSNIITAFLKYIEEERDCDTSTRNHRLLCIRSFYKYAAETDAFVVPHWNEIQKVKLAKVAKEPVGYMSETAIQIIISQPDITKEKGLRDMFLMLFLYHTGARVQELLNVRLCDISYGKAPTVMLCGKGKKMRSVPMRDKLVVHLKKYITAYHPFEDKHSETPLFFTKHGGKKRMTEDNVRRLVRQYGEMAAKISHEVPDRVHPHLFRHSRAMHLYQHGVHLTLVSQWLGHSKLETTLIYAYADTEQKRQAIEKAIPIESSLVQHLNASRYQVTDDETFKRLCGLK